MSHHLTDVLAGSLALRCSSFRGNLGGLETCQTLIYGVLPCIVLWKSNIDTGFFPHLDHLGCLQQDLAIVVDNISLRTFPVDKIVDFPAFLIQVTLNRIYKVNVHSCLDTNAQLFPEIQQSAELKGMGSLPCYLK